MVPGGYRIRTLGESERFDGYFAVGGSLLYVTLLDDPGPIETSFIGSAIPVFAALAGRLVVGQDVTPATAVGFAFILAGFGVVKWRALRGPSRRARPENRWANCQWLSREVADTEPPALWIRDQLPCAAEPRRRGRERVEAGRRLDHRRADHGDEHGEVKNGGDGRFERPVGVHRSAGGFK